MWFRDEDNDDWEEDQEEHDDAFEDLEEWIEKARGFVSDFYSSGQADEHEQQKSSEHYQDEYRETMACTMAEQILQLEKLLEQYDELQESSHGDLLEIDLYAGRIKTLVEALEQMESKLEYYDRKEEKVCAYHKQGRISDQAAADRLREIDFRKQRAATRTEMAGLGMTYDDLGEISDQFNHLTMNYLYDEDGEARHRIFVFLRSLDRDKAVYLLQQAVADGLISPETAEFLKDRALRNR